MKKIHWPKVDSTHLTVYPDQMVDLENEIFSRGMPEESLMEKVGINISHWLFGKRNLLTNGVVVAIGPGNNGGDGAVVARELFLKGILTKVWVPFPIKKQLTLKHLDYISFLGVETLTTPPNPASNELWIDSIFGNNQNRSVDDEIIKLFNKKFDNSCGKNISIDIPTGICPYSGIPFSKDAIKSNITLSIGLKKIGILQDAAKPFVGEIHHIDIGISPKQLNSVKRKIISLSGKDTRTLNFSLPPRNESKYRRGKTLIIVGSSKYHGAAMLAIQGALASGTGLVKAILPEEISKSIWQYAPELVVEGILERSNEGNSIMNRKLNELNLNQFDSIMVGPGIGIDSMDWSKSEEKLKSFNGLLILDADALNRISRSNSGNEFFLERQSDTWITPHYGEFKRLFPDLDFKNNLESALYVAKKFNIGILLKGANSIVADPENNAWQIYDSNFTSARAGLGDLLSGFIAGISALELSSGEKLRIDSLAKYALLHSLAGKKCKSGTSASDIGKKLAKIVKKVKTRQML